MMETYTLTICFTWSCYERGENAFIYISLRCHAKRYLMANRKQLLVTMNFSPANIFLMFIYIWKYAIGNASLPAYSLFISSLTIISPIWIIHISPVSGVVKIQFGYMLTKWVWYEDITCKRYTRDADDSCVAFISCDSLVSWWADIFSWPFAAGPTACALSCASSRHISIFHFTSLSFHRGMLPARLFDLAWANAEADISGVPGLSFVDAAFAFSDLWDRHAWLY